MKANKTIGWLLMILVLLGIFVVVRDRRQTEKPILPDYTAAINGVTTEAVDQVELVKGSTRLTLKKAAAGWQVNEFKANQEKIKQLIGRILTPIEPELIAETALQHKSLGVDQESGTTVVISNNDKKVNLIIGNAEKNGYYVRVGDGNKVYLIKELPEGADEVLSDGWLDKNLTQVTEANIKNLIYTDQKGQVLKLNRVGSEWFEEGKLTPLATEPLSPLLTTLAALKGQELISDEKSLGKVLLTLVINTDNASQTLKIFPIGQDQYAMESSDRKGKFTIDKATFEALKLDPKTLQAKPTPSPTATP